MSSDRFPNHDSGPDGLGPNANLETNEPADHDNVLVDAGGDELLESLRAFGLTLESETAHAIRPAPVIGEGPRRSSALRRVPPRAGVWLAAAAVLVAVGFGLGAIWQNQTNSIDSVGETPAEGSDDGEDREGDGPTADETDPAPGDGGDGQSGLLPEGTPAPPEPEPSTIVGSDGTQLALADETTVADIPGDADEPPGDQPPGSRQQVIVAAVVDELLAVGAFTSLDRAQLTELLTTGDLTVETTLDPAIHDMALAAIEEVYPNPWDLVFEPGLVTVDNSTGAIVAISSADSGWDGLAATPRQPGSAFKSFVLARALEDGIGQSDLVRADGPCSFPDPNQGGEDVTVGGSFREAQRIDSATRSSNNCAFVRLGQIVGTDRVVDLAEDLGLTLPPDADERVDLPLGVTETSAIEMTGAYAAFANGGRFQRPWLVAEVRDRDGQVLYRHADDPTRVVSERTADLVTDTLYGNVLTGTGRRAELSGGRWAAGKTGTTRNFSNAWFVGYTDRYTTAVWLGDRIDGREIRIVGHNAFGGDLPASVWGRYMEDLHRDLPLPPPRPEPQFGGQEEDGVFLEVEGELRFCSSEAPLDPVGLEQVDTDGDGVADCVAVVEG